MPDSREAGGRWCLPAGPTARLAVERLEADGWRVHVRRLAGLACLITFVLPGASPHAGELLDAARWCRRLLAALGAAKRRRRGPARPEPPRVFLPPGPGRAPAFCACGAMAWIAVPIWARSTQHWAGECDSCGDPRGLVAWQGLQSPPFGWWQPMHAHPDDLPSCEDGGVACMRHWQAMRLWEEPASPGGVRPDSGGLAANYVRRRPTLVRE